MTSLLLVESGSSKTDWCFISKNQKPVSCQTSGLNPYHRSEQDCLEALAKELELNIDKNDEFKIIFYGAGIKDSILSSSIEKILTNLFGKREIEIHSDILAAARATCGHEKGMVCILGTGSNSGYYNGKIMESTNPSLGYIIGDEGSGTYLGKRVLQYYFYNTFDDDLKANFEDKYGNNISEILHKIYKEPMGNTYLASFTEFLKENREHFMVQNIIEDAFIDFHQRHVLKFRQSWKYPIHFVGSVAYEFKDILLDLQEQFGLETGKIMKSPLKALIDFHHKALAEA